MPRIVKVTVPPEKTNYLIQDLSKLIEVFEIQLEKGVSILPKADQVTVNVPTSELNKVMRILDQFGLGKENGVSVITTEPDSMITTKHHNKLDRDSNEATWEEMEMLIAKDSNTTLPTLLLMFLAGSLSIIGIATNALHIVIGGMLIAPGFMPLMRFSLGVVSKSIVWQRGLTDVFKSYSVLLVGAVTTALFLEIAGIDTLKRNPSYYLINMSLMNYWSKITLPSILASVVASIAGSVLITTKRSVFTSGVMIGLALVPSSALIGAALILGNPETAFGALKRWIVDVFLIIIISFLMFLLVQRKQQKRKMRV